MVLRIRGHPFIEHRGDPRYTELLRRLDLPE
jgi:hypothetical protein